MPARDSVFRRLNLSDLRDANGRPTGGFISSVRQDAGSPFETIDQQETMDIFSFFVV